MQAEGQQSNRVRCRDSRKKGGLCMQVKLRCLSNRNELRCYSYEAVSSLKPPNLLDLLSRDQGVL